MSGGADFRGDPPRRAPDLRPAGPRRGASAPGRSACVLVIDDDEDDRVVIARALVRARPRLQVVEATTVAEALSMIVEHAPAFALLDLRMDGTDGFEVLAASRGGSGRPRVPLVVFSTSDSPDDIRRAYELGANAYVQKPASLADYERLARRLADFWIDTVARP